MAANLDLQPLPVGSVGRQASGWWGMWLLVTTEAALFGYLLFAYYYLHAQGHSAWPPGGLPSLRLALPNTLILIASSGCAWWGERGIRRNQAWRLVLGLLAALVLGSVFLYVQVLEWHHKSFSLSDDAYGSLYFTTTGFHMAHVIGGLAVLATLCLWTCLHYFNGSRHAAVSIGVLYWHFVDVVWLAVFTTFYLTPYLFT